jgi:hypothetical protein
LIGLWASAKMTLTSYSVIVIASGTTLLADIIKSLIVGRENDFDERIVGIIEYDQRRIATLARIAESNSGSIRDLRKDPP